MPRQKLEKRYICGRGWMKCPAVSVRTPEGKGLFIPGERTPRGGALPLAAIAAPVVASAAAPLVERGVREGMKGLEKLLSGKGITPAGTGLRPAGTGMQVAGAGKDFFKDLGKTLSKGVKTVGKFLNKPGTKAVIRQLRKSGSPLLRSLIPGLVSTGAQSTALIPGVGSAIAPVAQAAAPLATKGILKGLDVAEKEAEKRGFAYRSGRGMPIDAHKLKKKQLGKDNQRMSMDMRSINVYPRVAQSAPMRGKGLRPL